MEKVYFVGEYGFAFRHLLPFLDQYTESLELITWSSMCDLIELLWPGKHRLIKAETLMNFNPECRNCNTGEEGYVSSKGYKNISTLSDKFFRIHIFIDDGIIKRKIFFGEQSENKKYISVFARGRKLRQNKNKLDNMHLEWIKNNYPNYEIVGHGIKGERKELPIRYCNDIYEQINVLNNSLFFLSDDSGIVDLALMCGCDLILTSKKFNEDFNYMEFIMQSNPNNCNVRFFDDIVDNS